MADGFRCSNCCWQESEHEDSSSLSPEDAKEVCGVYTPTGPERLHQAKLKAAQNLGARPQIALLLVQTRHGPKAVPVDIGS